MNKTAFIIVIALSILSLNSCRESRKERGPETTDTTTLGHGGSRTDTNAPKEGMTGNTSNWWKTAGTTRSITGKVVSFDKLVTGGSGSVTRSEAEKMHDEGRMLVFTDNNNVYFVYNPDGSYADDKLMDFADKKSVTVTGRYVNSGNINMIIVERVEGND